MRLFTDVVKWYYSHELQKYQLPGGEGGYYLTETEMRQFQAWAVAFLVEAPDSEIPTVAAWIEAGGQAEPIVPRKGRSTGVKITNS